MSKQLSLMTLITYLTLIYRHGLTVERDAVIEIICDFERRIRHRRHATLSKETQ